MEEGEGEEEKHDATCATTRPSWRRQKSEIGFLAKADDISRLCGPAAPRPRLRRVTGCLPRVILPSHRARTRHANLPYMYATVLDVATQQSCIGHFG